MEIKTEYPRKLVFNHAFYFLNGQSFLITVDSENDIEEFPNGFDLNVTETDSEGVMSTQSTTIYKTNLLYHSCTTRTVIDYPKGQSPAELAIAEIAERQDRRLAAKSRLPRPEGA